MANELEVRRTEFRSPEVQALVTALTAELSALYPEQSAAHFIVDPDDFGGARGAFVLAHAGGAIAGCGGVRRIAPGVGEIKRMYVVPSARGRGVGGAIVRALEAEARRLGLTRLVLETGRRQGPAIALYERAGFTHTPPYGEYVHSPMSVCMSKELPGAG